MMTGNRLAHRTVLLLAGLLLLSGGVILLVETSSPATISSLARQGLSTIKALTAPAMSEVTMISLAAVGFLLGLASFVFAVTRWRGRTNVLLHTQAATGETLVNTRVAEAALAEPLRNCPGVSSTQAQAYRVKGTTLLKVDTTLRRGARPDTVLETAEESVHAWDALLGTRLPVLIHLRAQGQFSRLTGRHY